MIPLTTPSSPQRARRRTFAVGVALLSLAVPAAADAKGPHGHGHGARSWERSAPDFGSAGNRAVYAHRGASAYRPEHTIEAYRLAVEQGADFIEPDLVSTKDGVLVDRHENEISGTTDVATRPEFAARKTTKTIDGVATTGWFTEDFTLAELRSLRAKERLPALRPGSVAYDGKYQVPTLQEVVDYARKASRQTGRTIGLVPEIKHSTYFRTIGLNQESALLKVLRQNRLDHRRAPVIVQSFEVANLKELHRTSRVHTVQLLNATGAPADVQAAGGTTTYADMVTPAGLRKIASYADAVAPNTNWVIPRDPTTGASQAPTSFVRDAHRAGLPVVVWTFRGENSFLPPERRNGTDPAARGDLQGYITQFLELGVDGIFSDNPDVAAAAIRAFEARQGGGHGYGGGHGHGHGGEDRDGEDRGDKGGKGRDGHGRGGKGEKGRGDDRAAALVG